MSVGIIKYNKPKGALMAKTRTVKQPYNQRQAKSTFVMISQEDTIKDLKSIQDILFSETGVSISLQQVVNHLIHEYLKER